MFSQAIAAASSTVASGLLAVLSQKPATNSTKPTQATSPSIEKSTTPPAGNSAIATAFLAFVNSQQEAISGRLDPTALPGPLPLTVKDRDVE